MVDAIPTIISLLPREWFFVNDQLQDLSALAWTLSCFALIDSSLAFFLCDADMFLINSSAQLLWAASSIE
jgi:hypothetical protein